MISLSYITRVAYIARLFKTFEQNHKRKMLKLEWEGDLMIFGLLKIFYPMSHKLISLFLYCRNINLPAQHSKLKKNRQLLIVIHMFDTSSDYIKSQVS